MTHLVFLSGTLRAGSRADRLARWCAAQSAPCSTAVFTGADLDFPFYGAGPVPPRARRFLTELAASDGVVMISPAYHGSLSGLLKNALDYVNELAGDPRPFLDGRTVGCVALAMGEQGAASTVGSLRTVAHALRGWPTPLGVGLSGDRAELRPDGEPALARSRERLCVLIDQVRSSGVRSPDGLLPAAGVVTAS